MKPLAIVTGLCLALVPTLSLAGDKPAAASWGNSFSPYISAEDAYYRYFIAKDMFGAEHGSFTKLPVYNVFNTTAFTQNIGNQNIVSIEAIDSTVSVTTTQDAAGLSQQGSSKATSNSGSGSFSTNDIINLQ